MSRGQFDRRRQMSPFTFAIIVIVGSLVLLCALVTFFAPAGAAS